MCLLDAILETQRLQKAELSHCVERQSQSSPAAASSVEDKPQYMRLLGPSDYAATLTHIRTLSSSSEILPTIQDKTIFFHLVLLVVPNSLFLVPWIFLVTILVWFLVSSRVHLLEQSSTNYNNRCITKHLAIQPQGPSCHSHSSLFTWSRSSLRPFWNPLQTIKQQVSQLLHLQPNHRLLQNNTYHFSSPTAPPVSCESIDLFTALSRECLFALWYIICLKKTVIMTLNLERCFYCE